jgi:hypothetical protein
LRLDEGFEVVADGGECKTEPASDLGLAVAGEMKVLYSVMHA